MAGLSLNMGGMGQVYAGPGWSDGPGVPAAAQQPAGPTTVSQKAFGIVAGGPGVHRLGLLAVFGGGGLSIAALVFIWWSLPR
jgi:hypothetical protein